MRAFVTGGAGFIGSHLVEWLLGHGHHVTVYDNFRSGKRDFLPHNNSLRIVTNDAIKRAALTKAMMGHDMVFHFCANADVRKGLKRTKLDLEQETIATYNVLEAMRINGIKQIIFPSSMTIYGRPTVSLVSETYGPCLPISLYGAAKLACEGLISAYCEMFEMRAWIFRFANIVGARTTHGVIYDLINKVLHNRNKLHVLGNGNQSKPFLFIDDAIEGIFYLMDQSSERVNIFNVSPPDALRVKDIVHILVHVMEIPKISIQYEANPYGWKGDVSTIILDISKAKQHGFHTRYTSRTAAIKAIEQRLIEVDYHP